MNAEKPVLHNHNRNELASVLAVAHGRVQGVGFRFFVERHARTLGLVGYVRNLPGSRSVEVRAEGRKERLEELVKHVGQGPPLSRVEKLDVAWGEYSGQFRHFEVSY